MTHPNSSIMTPVTEVRANPASAATRLTLDRGMFETHKFMDRRTERLFTNRVKLSVFALWALGWILFHPGLSLQAQDGGVAGGKLHAPLLDSEQRPLTVGGLTPGARVVYQDITSETGLDRFQHRAGFPEKRYIIDTKGGGVALFDYDLDGFLDIYLITGSEFSALLGEAEYLPSALFHNNGDGTFTDVTVRAGVPNLAWGFGLVAGDFDNDGWPDLYVSNLGANRLYRNNGDGTFKDVAKAAGVDLPTALTTGAAFGDYNHDGLLDLFVCGYAEFDPANPPRSGVDVPINYCKFRGVDVMCGPRGLPGTRDFLFRNNGDGTFVEVAEAAGVADKAGYYGFSPAWVDVNDDGWVDLVVANDSTPNYLYLNKKDGTFEDVSYISGFALNEDAREQAGMGLAIGDYNHDGLVDFYVAHFSDDYNTLYENQGDDFFVDMSYEVGLAEATIPFVSWGTGFIDFDNDGFEDLFVVNGHVYPAVDQHNWGTTWAQRPLLFKNEAGKEFQTLPAAPDSGLATALTGRGAAFGDLDNDGRVDVVVNCLDSSPRVLRNVWPDPGNWISVVLTGGEHDARGGVGATLYLTSGGTRQRRDVYTGGSFVSHSDQRAHFGVGNAERVEKLEIRWPGGEMQTLTDLPVNRLIEVLRVENRYRVIELKEWGKK